MIDTELAFEAVGRQRVRGSHESRAVHDDVDVKNIGPRVDGFRRLPDGSEGVEVERQGSDLDPRLYGFDCVCCLLELFLAAAGEYEEAGLAFGDGFHERSADGATSDACAENYLAFDFAGEVAHQLVRSSVGVVGVPHC